MSWLKPNQEEKIIKNIVESITLDLELLDFEPNTQYKKEMFTFFKKVFAKYGFFKTDHIDTIEI